MWICSFFSDHFKALKLFLSSLKRRHFLSGLRFSETKNIGFKRLGFNMLQRKHVIFHHPAIPKQGNTICAMVKSRVSLGDKLIPPLMTESL